MTTEKLGVHRPVEAEPVRHLLRVLLRVVRSSRLYDAGHATVDDLIAQLRQSWEEACRRGPVQLRFTAQEVFLDEDCVFSASRGADVLPSHLYHDGVVGLVLRKGLEREEATRLVKALAEEPDPSFDFASLLWEADLKHVQVLLDADDAYPEPETSEEFAREMTSITRPEDPPVGEDYGEEREELDRIVAERVHTEPCKSDLFALTSRERASVERLLEGDVYAETLRHASRMLLCLAAHEADPADAEAQERAVHDVVAGLASAGDLAACLEVLAKAREMLDGDRPRGANAAEVAIATLAQPEAFASFLDAVDRRESLSAESLRELFTLAGPAVLAPAAAWLCRAKHGEEAAAALESLGEPATKALAAVFSSAGPQARARLVPSLLKIGTPSALLPLAADFSALPENGRMRLLSIAARMEEGVRDLLTHALDDPSEQVRRVAVSSLRKVDAPRLAHALQALLRGEALQRRDPSEVHDLFETAARIGDASVARVLAERCAVKGLRARYRALDGDQELCARTLRRMRDPGAREVVEQLRRRAPRAVRAILDDPLADF